MQAAVYIVTCACDHRRFYGSTNTAAVIVIETSKNIANAFYFAITVFQCFFRSLYAAQSSYL